uniref:Uncharacterized protein n=1 Tax=Opuntia streptacantha TaxID=393608 RepID=A0A7C8ZK66_OPUST
MFRFAQADLFFFVHILYFDEKRRAFGTICGGRTGGIAPHDSFIYFWSIEMQIIRALGVVDKINMIFFAGWSLAVLTFTLFNMSMPWNFFFAKIVCKFLA